MGWVRAAGLFLGLALGIAVAAAGYLAAVAWFVLSFLPGP